MAYHQPWSLSEVESFTGALSHITMRLIYWPCPKCNSILSHIFFSLYFQGLQEDSCQRWHLRDRFTEEEDKCQISFGAHKFSSVTQLCPTLCDPMDCSTPGFPDHHQFLELAQIHVHRVGDAIQPSHPLSSPSPHPFNRFQHQGLFQGVSSSHQVAKVLEFQLQHQSFQWIFRTDLL